MSTNNDTFDWKRHTANLKATKAVSNEAIRQVSMFTHNNIGFEQGQMRPGLMGRWDVYFSVNLPMPEKILVSGLTVGEIAHEQEREATIDQWGLDPDDPRQAEELKVQRGLQATLEEMFPNSFDDRIKFLKSLL